MPSDYDATEFVDGDFQAHKSPLAAAPGPGELQRAPSRDELDHQVTEAQQKLAELKRAQEELERQRAALAEARRRQMEFETGRQEMTQHLTRGVGLLEEAEFNLRRDAEQMAKALAGLREALQRVQSIHDDTWTKDNYEVELTRALTVIENARMEWNSARLKFPVLSGAVETPASAASGDLVPSGAFPANLTFRDWCRLGLALTWPLAAIALLILAVLLVLLLRQ
jgi:predicted nuclease with TOPRIM domain